MAVLYGVSVGPGNPELMTLEAVRIINQCQVIAVPRTKGEHVMALSIAEQVCDLKDKQLMYADFPMTRVQSVLDQNYADIVARITEFLDGGQDVAFLNIGDVSIYSTFSYIAGLVAEAGYEAVYCPGVTSFSAVAAKLKMPLVQKREALTIISGDSEPLDALLAVPGNKVIMKCGHRMDVLRTRLADKCVSGVSNCGLTDEKIYDSLEEMKDTKGYFTTMIVKDNEQC